MWLRVITLHIMTLCNQCTVNSFYFKGKKSDGVMYRLLSRTGQVCNRVAYE